MIVENPPVSSQATAPEPDWENKLLFDHTGSLVRDGGFLVPIQVVKDAMTDSEDAEGRPRAVLRISVHPVEGTYDTYTVSRGNFTDSLRQVVVSFPEISTLPLKAQAVTIEKWLDLNEFIVFSTNSDESPEEFFGRVTEALTKLQS